MDKRRSARSASVHPGPLVDTGGRDQWDHLSHHTERRRLMILTIHAKPERGDPAIASATLVEGGAGCFAGSYAGWVTRKIHQTKAPHSAAATSSFP